MSHIPIYLKLRIDYTTDLITKYGLSGGCRRRDLKPLKNMGITVMFIMVNRDFVTKLRDYWYEICMNFIKSHSAPFVFKCRKLCFLPKKDPQFLAAIVEDESRLLAELREYVLHCLDNFEYKREMRIVERMNGNYGHISLTRKNAAIQSMFRIPTPTSLYYGKDSFTIPLDYYNFVIVSNENMDYLYPHSGFLYNIKKDGIKVTESQAYELISLLSLPLNSTFIVKTPNNSYIIRIDKVQPYKLKTLHKIESFRFKYAINTAYPLIKPVSSKLPKTKAQQYIQAYLLLLEKFCIC